MLPVINVNKLERESNVRRGKGKVVCGNFCLYSSICVCSYFSYKRTTKALDNRQHQMENSLAVFEKTVEFLKLSVFHSQFFFFSVLKVHIQHGFSCCFSKYCIIVLKLVAVKSVAETQS